MKNKVLVEIFFPTIGEIQDVFLPINKQLGEVRNLLVKMINEEAEFPYLQEDSCTLYDKDSGAVYDLNRLVKDTDIRNGSRLILL